MGGGGVYGEVVRIEVGVGGGEVLYAEGAKTVSSVDWHC